MIHFITFSELRPRWRRGVAGNDCRCPNSRGGARRWDTESDSEPEDNRSQRSSHASSSRRTSQTVEEVKSLDDVSTENQYLEKHSFLFYSE